MFALSGFHAEGVGGRRGPKPGGFEGCLGGNSTGNNLTLPLVPLNLTTPQPYPIREAVNPLVIC